MHIASITSTLAPLAVLACPIGMGLMMWMMARGNRSEQRPSQASPEAPSQPVSLEVLREEHCRLGEEIERLEEANAASPEPEPQRR